MSDNYKNILGASLLALAFSLNAQNATAQTCSTPPDCATLGFTKTAADCSGKTILKCPFNQAQVYCPGSEEQSETYTIGDLYPKTGVSIGVVIAINNGNYVVSSIPKYVDNSNNATSFCDDFNLGGYTWSTPSLPEAITIYKTFKTQIGSDNCIKIMPESIYNCAKNGKESISIYKGYNACILYARP